MNTFICCYIFRPRLPLPAHAGRALALILSLALLLPAPANARNVPYAPFNMIDDGLDGAMSVDAADLDSDGDLDVLAGSKFQDQLTWYRNFNGSGGSWVRYVLAADYGIVWDVTAADINSDGKLDILVSHGSYLNWWENLYGDGSHWQEHDIADGQDDRSIQAVDLDGDGDLDVVAGDYSHDDLDWWENIDGAGTNWSGHTLNGSFDGVISERAGDIDGDGDLDILAAGFYCDCIRWWENTGGAVHWIERTIKTGYLGASAVWIDDVNHDGAQDLLAAAAHSDVVTWWDNIWGDGSEFVEHTIRSGFDYAYSVETADMDGDGDQDVLASALYSSRASWFEKGAGWAEHLADAAPGAGQSDGHAADIDGDGDLDVLIANYYGDQIGWRENLTIHRGADFPLYLNMAIDFDGARDVALGDLDADGDLDILGSASVASDLVWWKISGMEMTDEDWEAPEENEYLPPVESVALEESPLADGPAETPPYLATSKPEAGTDFPVTNPANLGEAAAPNFSIERRVISSDLSGATGVAIADIDGDNSMDAVAASYWTGQVLWYDNSLGDGSEWWVHTAADDLPTVIDLLTADFDADGDMDIAAITEYSTPVVFLENMDGYGLSWMEQYVDNTHSNANSLAVADIDHDGDLDLLGTMNSSPNYAVVWWENTGGAGHAWERHVIHPGFGADAVTAGDIDGNGILDVVVASRTADTVLWYENLSGQATTWARHDVDGANGARSIQVVDFDLDGDLDIATAAGDGDALIWTENLSGSGMAWAHHDISGRLDWPYSLATGDIDHDADPDIVAASFNQDSISLHSNDGGQFALKTGSTGALYIPPGAKKAVLIIRGIHRGRVDSNAEIERFIFRIEHSPGSGLSTYEANLVISKLQIYRDDGSWTFNPSMDTQVTTLEDLIMTNGWLTVQFPDSHPLVQIPSTTPYNYFVVLETTHNSNVWPVNQCILTHWSADSRVEDSTSDIPLLLEYEPHINSGVIRFDYLPVYLPMVIQ